MSQIHWDICPIFNQVHQTWKHFTNKYMPIPILPSAYPLTFKLNHFLLQSGIIEQRQPIKNTFAYSSSPSRERKAIGDSQGEGDKNTKNLIFADFLPIFIPPQLKKGFLIIEETLSHNSFSIYSRAATNSTRARPRRLNASVATWVIIR